MSCGLEKDENLHKWQQVVPQNYLLALQQNKKVAYRNREDKKFKLFFEDSITKLIGEEKI